MDIEEKKTDISTLVERCCKNDLKAQMQLYRLFSPAMFNSSLRIVGDRYIAEDVMQESFLTAFEKIKDCKTPSYFGSWLKRIVINKSIDEIRKKKIRLQPLDESLSIEYESVETLQEEENEQLKLLEYIKKGINLLPDGYRIVLILKLMEDYDYGNIAKELGLAESTVRSQYVRGKQKLVEIIKNLKKEDHDKY